MKQTEVLTHVGHVNGCEPAVYMTYMSQNFRLFHVSNLSVLSFLIFLLMYPGSLALHLSVAVSVRLCGVQLLHFSVEVLLLLVEYVVSADLVAAE